MNIIEAIDIRSVLDVFPVVVETEKERSYW